MTVGEALDLIKILARDPGSWAHAAMAGWSYAASREFFVLADIFDAFAKVHFRHPKPHERPTPDKSVSVERLGEPIRPADLADVLRAFGRPVPDGLEAPTPDTAPDTVPETAQGTAGGVVVAAVGDVGTTGDQSGVGGQGAAAGPTPARMPSVRPAWMRS